MLFGCRKGLFYLRSAFILALKFPFEQEDLIAKLHTLGGDAVGEQGSVRWQSLNEFLARMSPASATYCLGQLVVAVVTEPAQTTYPEYAPRKFRAFSPFLVGEYSKRMLLCFSYLPAHIYLDDGQAVPRVRFHAVNLPRTKDACSAAYTKINGYFIAI